jgi:anti-anti-sigma factor
LEGVDFSPVQQTEFRTTIQSMLQSADTSPVAICTGGLGLVGSCCLAALIEAAMTCHRQGTPVVIVEDRAQVLEVFEVVSLHSLVAVQSSLENAPGAAPSP